jgi:subtilisin family serine protease
MHQCGPQLPSAFCCVSKQTISSWRRVRNVIFLKPVYISLLLVAIALPAAADEFYYISKGQAPLRIDSTKVLIKFDSTARAGFLDGYRRLIPRLASIIPSADVMDNFIPCSLSVSSGYIAFLDSLRSVQGVLLAEPYYRSPNDSPMVVGDRYYVAFAETTPRSTIDSINSANHAVVDHELYGMHNVFMLRNTLASGRRVVQMANAYHDIAGVRYAHPGFAVRAKQCAYKLYDKFAYFQPHLKKVIGAFNSASVWDFAGLTRTVSVALLDDGLTSHEDLPASRIAPTGYDFANKDYDPSPGDSMAHGMACAGIIGASHTTDSASGIYDSSGMISLNSKVTFVPIKIFSDDGWGMYPEEIAEAFTWTYLHGAEVISNSWGFYNPMWWYDSPTLNDAIRRASQDGRGGKGCPVIFASGNVGDNQSWRGLLDYPARLPYCFAVGAIDLSDQRYSYSSFGLDLSVVAPSSELCLQGDVFSLDQMGNLGYNPFVTSYCDSNVSWGCGWRANNPNYDCRFGGTSAAAPVAAGVASLLLARDSNLTCTEIYDIMRQSAVRDLESGSLTPPDSQYGYGRVDAFRAILAIARGDASNDGLFDISDVQAIVDYVFFGNPIYPSPLLGDCDCTGTVDVADVQYIVDYILNGGPAPRKPCFEY